MKVIAIFCISFIATVHNLPPIDEHLVEGKVIQHDEPVRSAPAVEEIPDLLTRIRQILDEGSTEDGGITVAPFTRRTRPTRVTRSTRSRTTRTRRTVKPRTTAATNTFDLEDSPRSGELVAPELSKVESGYEGEPTSEVKPVEETKPVSEVEESSNNQAPSTTTTTTEANPVATTHSQPTPASIIVIPATSEVTPTSTVDYDAVISTIETLQTALGGLEYDIDRVCMYGNPVIAHNRPKGNPFKDYIQRMTEMQQGNSDTFKELFGDFPVEKLRSGPISEGGVDSFEGSPGLSPTYFASSPSITVKGSNIPISASGSPSRVPDLTATVRPAPKVPLLGSGAEAPKEQLKQIPRPVLRGFEKEDLKKVSGLQDAIRRSLESMIPKMEYIQSFDSSKATDKDWNKLYESMRYVSKQLQNKSIAQVLQPSKPESLVRNNEELQRKKDEIQRWLDEANAKYS